MFIVNKEKKQLIRLEEASFQDIKCKERNDFQEWIVNEPSILGEDLLIIQKEFAGFDNTRERLDVLALDKSGNIVVIENKTDDTGSNVVWQAVKYASYCSTLLPYEIKEIYAQYIQKNKLNLDAEQSILDFLAAESFDSIKLNESNSQRIILVAKTFRKEVLSAALWLSNFGVNISCKQIQIYKCDKNIIIDSNQILPQKETLDFTIKLANKAKESQQATQALALSEKLRSEFWELFIPKFNSKSNLFKNISCIHRKDHWLSAAAGIGSGVQYSFLICKDYCGVELSIASPDKEHNKEIFDKLIEKKTEIELELKEYQLEWARLDDSCMSRISIHNSDLSLWNQESWDDIMDYLSTLMIAFETAIKKYSSAIRKNK